LSVAAVVPEASIVPDNQVNLATAALDCRGLPGVEAHFGFPVLISGFSLPVSRFRFLALRVIHSGNEARPPTLSDGVAGRLPDHGTLTKVASPPMRPQLIENQHGDVSQTLALHEGRGNSWD
jgi:hypothetical protein